MKLTNSFSAREVRELGRLPKTLKKFKWATVFFCIFLLSMSILNVRTALVAGHQHGIDGLRGVISLWVNGVRPGRTYEWFEMLIFDRMGTAALQVGTAIVSLAFSLGTRRLQKLLLKCWNLLASAYPLDTSRPDHP